MSIRNVVVAGIIVLIVVAGGYFLFGADTTRPQSPQPALNLNPPTTTPSVPRTD